MSRMFRRFFSCMILLCMTGCVVFCALQQKGTAMQQVAVLSEADEEQAFCNVLSSCVRIQGEGHYGSGIIYGITERQYIIVTNRHVLAYFGEDSYVTFYDGQCAEGEILFLSTDYDLGFLAVDKGALTEEEATIYQSVSYEQAVYDKLQKNDSFFMPDIATDIHHPRKYSGEVTDSCKYLKDYGQEMFYGDAYAKGGMSGCGVFDGYGHFLALLSGGTEYNEIAAVPLAVIETEYKKINQFT